MVRHDIHLKITSAEQLFGEFVDGMELQLK